MLYKSYFSSAICQAPENTEALAAGRAQREPEEGLGPGGGGGTDWNAPA